MADIDEFAAAFDEVFSDKPAEPAVVEPDAKVLPVETPPA